MSNTYEALIHQAYNAFNKRDIDAALQLMTPDVDWPNGWEGGYVQGHDAVRDYWSRQWQAIDPSVTPLAIHERPDGKQEVLVQQTVKDKEGKLIYTGQVKHIYTIKNGLIQHMLIEKD